MSSSSSSRSSMSLSSASDRMYSPEQLLQLALSRGSQSTTAASATLLQLHAARFLPVADILVESEADADSSNSGHSSNTSAVSSDEESDSEHEEEDTFMYGEGVLRSDLSLELIEELKEAVHGALDEAYFNMSSSESDSKPVLPLRVYVSANPQRQRTTGQSTWQFRHPIVSSEASWRSKNTNQQRRANPNAVFGSPRRTFGLAPNSNPKLAGNDNSQMDSWRSTLKARRMETARDWRPSISKEASTTSWRRTQAIWNDAAGSYVVTNA